MNINYDVIYCTIQSYKEILRKTCPADYYQKQSEKLETALDWLESIALLEMPNPREFGGV